MHKSEIIKPGDVLHLFMRVGIGQDTAQMTSFVHFVRKEDAEYRDVCIGDGQKLTVWCDCCPSSERYGTFRLSRVLGGEDRIYFVDGTSTTLEDLRTHSLPKARAW